MTAASGSQFRIRSGKYEARIASVGATLRVLRYEGRDLVVPFAADEVRPAYRGATLAPWPNRVVDGVYSAQEETFQLALNEPKRQHALHGLLAWQEFVCVRHSSNSVTLTSRVIPQTGYPWSIAVVVTYTLDAKGLTQEVKATNESDAVAPYGTATHPYVVAGSGALDTWTLELPASQVLEVTDDRLSPVALRDVGEYQPERFDYRSRRVIGANEIDHAYTGLPAGGVVVRVTDPSGTGVEVSWGDDCPWVQIHTADLAPEEGTTRLGLALEPMTCAPDAFNDANYEYDTGLVRLEPGATHEASWTIAAI